MAIRDIKPTRSELIELKKKIKLAESGHKLLKMKRDGLILEFFELLSRAKDVRSELNSAYEVANEKIGLAKSVEGTVAIKSIAFALRDVPHIELESKNVMGVVVPHIESTQVQKNLYERGYGIIGTSSCLDEAVEAHEKLVEKMDSQNLWRVQLR